MRAQHDAHGPQSGQESVEQPEFQRLDIQHETDHDHDQRGGRQQGHIRQVGEYPIHPTTN